MTDLPKIRYATVAEMERLSRPSIRDAVLYCDETGKTYSFQGTSGAVRDGDDVLNTGLGGDTRFEAIAGGTVPGGTIAWGSVTKTGSSLADLATRLHSDLTDKGTNAHSAIDSFIGSKAQASGLASLNSSTLVVENPANATATPTASKIPIADGSGTLDGWITAGSTSAAGLVKLANHLGGTSTLPTVIGIQETGGPTSLLYGAVADGQYLKRSGSNIIGDTLTAADVAAGAFPGTAYTIPGNLTLQAENPVVNLITNDAGVTGTVGFIFKTNPSNNHMWAAVAYGTNYTLASSADDFAFQYYNGSTWVLPLWLEKTGDIGLGTTLPGARLHVYGNVTGATNPVLLVQQDHASNTGALIKGVHDGSGDLLQLYNGATQETKITYDGIMDIKTGFRVNAAATAGYVLQGNGTNIVPTALYTIIPVVFYEAGSVIATGLKGYSLPIPFNCEIVEWTLLGDVSGSVVMDAWKAPYSSYPPTVANTITAAAKPTISSATKAQSSTLTGWTTSVSAGDIFGWSIDSLSTFTWLGFALKVRRT